MLCRRCYVFRDSAFEAASATDRLVDAREVYDEASFRIAIVIREGLLHSISGRR
jgi:hypothetical protein